MRELTARVLRDAGHEVATAESAEDAHELLGAGTGVDVLITDINLPGQDGMDLARSVVDLRPDAGIILISGDVSPPPHEVADIRPDVVFVPKPFRPSEMIEHVQRVARQRAGALKAE